MSTLKESAQALKAILGSGAFPLPEGISTEDVTESLDRIISDPKPGPIFIRCDADLEEHLEVKEKLSDIFKKVKLTGGSSDV